MILSVPMKKMMNKYPKYNLQSFNYKLIIGAFLLLILSYFLMYIGSKNNLKFLSLTLAPIIQIAGYLTIIFAIMRQPKNCNASKS